MTGDAPTTAQLGAHRPVPYPAGQSAAKAWLAFGGSAAQSTATALWAAYQARGGHLSWADVIAVLYVALGGSSGLGAAVWQKSNRTKG